MPDVQKEWNMQDTLLGVSYMARKEHIDRIVALDDFDVEKAATLREHLRVPGMGNTAARSSGTNLQCAAGRVTGAWRFRTTSRC